MIRKVEIFIDDEKGFEVRKMSCVAPDSIILAKFQGSAVVMFKAPSGEEHPQHFTFNFPDAVKDIEEAFKTFEPCIQAELKRQQEEFQKKMIEKMKEDKSKIVLPGDPGLGMQFPGGRKK